MRSSFFTSFREFQFQQYVSLSLNLVFEHGFNWENSFDIISGLAIYSF